MMKDKAKHSMMIFPVRRGYNDLAQSKITETTEESKPASRIARPPQGLLRTISLPAWQSIHVSGEE